MTYTQTHLKSLEYESIHIIREVASEFKNPVMLYSIGKDSAVMLHLARKAFYASRLPFPLMHVDTTWKFRKMIEFRDRIAKEYDLDLIVHTNEEGLAKASGSSLCPTGPSRISGNISCWRISRLFRSIMPRNALS